LGDFRVEVDVGVENVDIWILTSEVAASGDQNLVD
jgi:hypothetical protein